MTLGEIASRLSGWLCGEGPMGDIVISCRVRLARNLAGFQFPSKCSASAKTEVEEKLRGVLCGLKSGEESLYIDVCQAGAIEREVLIERQLISRYHAKVNGARGVYVSGGESFAAMVNEEDHLRMQCLRAGLQLEECWSELNRIDDRIEEQVDYAFDEKYGYLTACPTNLGTAIRVSVMLHLPALKMTSEVDKVLRAAKDMNLTVRGMHGEGTEALGDFYQVSNQVTLGVSEEQLVEEFTTAIVPKVVEYERSAREQFAAKNPAALDDKVGRAMGLLSNARLVSSQEALHLLSHLRMAANMGRIKNISLAAINELFLLTQPAHLQFNCGRELDPGHRDALRAQMLRNALGKLN
jgi:protein arginine kinase